MTSQPVRFVDPCALPTVDAPVRSLSPRPCVSPGRVPTQQQRIALLMYDRVSSDPHHQQVKRQADARESPRPSKSGGGQHAQRPHFLVCYLCGQQFSKGSLKIHQPQCYVKQLIAWERGGASGTRGPRPMHPDEWHDTQAAEADGSLPMDHQAQQVDAFNVQQTKQFNAVGMSACENCGRTFLPDRLVVHQRSCRPGRAAKPVRQPHAAKRIAGVLPNEEPISTDGAERKLGSPQMETNSQQTSIDERVAPRSAAHIVVTPRATPVADGEVLSVDGNPLDPLSSTKRREPNSPEERCNSPGASPVVDMPRRFPRNAADSVERTGDQTLVRCRHCQRTFAPDRLERHEGVCIERSNTLPRAGSGSNPNSRGSSTTKIGAASKALLNSSFGRPASSGGASGRRPRVSPASIREMDSACTQPVDVFHSPRLDPRVPLRLSSMRPGTGSPGVDERQELQCTPPPGPHHSPKFCTECGERLAYDAQKFCGECGTRVVR